MGQFGIVARIALIVTAALFLSQFAVVLSYVWQSDRNTPPPFAVATRIVSVVRLLDRTPADTRPEALAVASVSGFKVSVLPAVPVTFEDDFSFARMRVATQRMMDDYETGRTVRSGTLDPAAGRPGDFTPTFAVPLKTGEVAVFTVSDDTTLRIWNLPIGFIAGFFGIVVALLAILAVARETRPIVKLAQSIDELGNRIEPIEVKERGARELRTLIRAINGMQRRILGLVNNRTIFLGAISHDLKTYLTRFRLRLEIMPAGMHRDKAILDVEAMERLLNDVLLFAKETSTQPPAETVDLCETLKHCAQEIDPAGMRITFTAVPGHPSENPNVRVPHTALRRVVSNLLSNAMRYGEKATVSTEKRGEMACFIVEDDGPGIGEEDLALVFEPFYRGEPSRNRALGGSGLGLSIVKQILDAHGGTIDLSNRQGEPGLRATVCLPLAPPAGGS